MKQQKNLLLLKNPDYRAKIDIILVNLVEHYWKQKI